jgi:hypothetical protein
MLYSILSRQDIDPLQLADCCCYLMVLSVGIFERFRGILHEGEIDKRVQFMIEGLFAIRKAQFQVWLLWFLLQPILAS